jgi:hypothetical protein
MKSIITFSKFGRVDATKFYIYTPKRKIRSITVWMLTGPQMESDLCIMRPCNKPRGKMTIKAP